MNRVIVIAAVFVLVFSGVAQSARKDVMYEPVAPGGPTHKQVVEQFFSLIFPSGFSYSGIRVSRDNVIAEKVERDGNSWWIVCRARYSGSLLGVQGSERARIHYDNGHVTVDLGGMKGAINTKGIANFIRKLNSAEVKDLRDVNQPSPKRIAIDEFNAKEDRLFAASGNTVYWQSGNELRGAKVVGDKLQFFLRFDEFNAKEDRLFAASGNTVYWQSGNELRGARVSNGELKFFIRHNGFDPKVDRLFAATGEVVYWQAGKQLRGMNVDAVK